MDHAMMGWKQFRTPIFPSEDAAMRTRAEIKAEARGLIQTARVSPLLVTAILLAVGFLLDRVVSLVETGSFFYTYSFTQEEISRIVNGDYQLLLDSIHVTPQSTFFSVLVALFNVVLSGGYYIYCMGIRRGQVMGCSSLLDGLSVAGKLIWCYVLTQIKIVLWSMLFVIPGIVAMYRYRFACYNVLTDSALSAGDAIRLSCRQTYGRKGSLFALDLSFLGWFLLSAVLSELAGPVLGVLVPVVFNLWLTPYQVLSDLGYYEESQRLIGRV